MMIDHLRRIVETLATLPDTEQELYAQRLESELQHDAQEQARIAAQLVNPNETDLEQLLTEADEDFAQGAVYDLDIIL